MDIGSLYLTNTALKWKHSVWFPSLIAYMICFGYIFCGRGFAGLHIPGVPIYIGEILLLMSCIYFFNELNRCGITRFQKPVLLTLVGFGCLFVKDVLFGDHDLMDVVRNLATVYYILFLFLCSGTQGAPFFTRIVDVLFKYQLLIALSLLIHVVFGPFLASFLIIGDDFYGLFCMPNCLVPPLATLLIIVIAENGRGEKRSSLKNITIGVCVGTIVLCQSRGGILGAIISLAYYICFLAKHRVHFVSRLTVATFLVAVLAPLLLHILPRLQERLFVERDYEEFHVYSVETVIAKFRALIDPQGENYKSGTGAARIIWWQAVIKDGKASMETLIFGQGFGQNLGESIDYGIRGAHNAWINIFGWTGLVGVFLYSLPFLSVFIFLTSARMRLNEDENTTGRLACNTGLVFLIAVLVSSMFDNSLSSPVTEVPLFIYLGSAVSMVRNSLRNRSPRGRHNANIDRS